ncbi:hypothetical protein BU15DRAFT_69157, partial [Melanogaster broomeanus]
MSLAMELMVTRTNAAIIHNSAVTLTLLPRLEACFRTARGSSGHRLFVTAFMLASKVTCDYGPPCLDQVSKEKLFTHKTRFPQHGNLSRPDDGTTIRVLDLAVDGQNWTKYCKKILRVAAEETLDRQYDGTDMPPVDATKHELKACQQRRNAIAKQFIPTHMLAARPGQGLQKWPRNSSESIEQWSNRQLGFFRHRAPHHSHPQKLRTRSTNPEIALHTIMTFPPSGTGNAFKHYHENLLSVKQCKGDYKVLVDSDVVMQGTSQSGPLPQTVAGPLPQDRCLGKVGPSAGTRGNTRNSRLNLTVKTHNAPTTRSSGPDATATSVNPAVLRGTSNNSAPGGMKAECSNCGATHTPLWHCGLNDELNCNACGLYCNLISAPLQEMVDVMDKSGQHNVAIATPQRLTVEERRRGVKPSVT